jgi:CheY-like chemotaxis protein
MSNPDSKGLILLIDDEPVVLDVGRLMLEKLGYNVLQATNGMEGAMARMNLSMLLYWLIIVSTTP